MAKIKITGQRKLRVTGQGAPRYQSQPGTILGSIGQPNSFSIPGFPTFGQSIHSVNYPSTQCPDGQQKNPITGVCEPIMDMNGQAQPNYTGGTPSISIDPGGPNTVRNPTTGKYETVDSFQKQPDIYKGQKTQRDLFNYNTMVPSAIIAGMSGIRGMAEGLQGNNLDIEYAKRLGQTDAFVGSTPNKMARGNLEINTGAQGLYTTPVQFAGRPTSEFVGYPSYQPQSFFRKEGGELEQYQSKGQVTRPIMYTNDLNKVKLSKDSSDLFNQGELFKNKFQTYVNEHNNFANQLITPGGKNVLPKLNLFDLRQPLDNPKIKPTKIQYVLGEGAMGNSKGDPNYQLTENINQRNHVYNDLSLPIDHFSEDGSRFNVNSYVNRVIKPLRTYKNPVYNYQYRKTEPTPEPTLHPSVMHMDPISFNTQHSTPQLRTMQQPNIEMPAVQRGQYRTSYYDPQMKDWNERAFMSQQESDQFANEMSQRGYPGSYGNVTQRMQYAEGGLAEYQMAGSVCPQGFTKNAFGQCVNASGQSPNQNSASKSIISQAAQPAPVNTKPLATPYKTRSQQVKENTDRANRENYHLGEFSDQASVGQGQASTAESEENRARLNQQYAQMHPYSKIDTQGNLSRSQYDRSMEGMADPNTTAAGIDKGMTHMQGAMDAAGMAIGVGELANIGWNGLKSMRRPIMSNAAVETLPAIQQSGVGNLKEMFTNPKQYFTKPIGKPYIAEGASKFRFEPTAPQNFTLPEFREAESIADLGGREGYNKFNSHFNQRIGNLKRRGSMYDQAGVADSNWLNPDTVHYHGTFDGRPIVETKMPNGNSEYFYKSSGWAGKQGAGANGTTEGMWQVYDQHGTALGKDARITKNWFAKGNEYDNWYGSNTFRNFAGNMDKTLTEKYALHPDELDQFLNFQNRSHKTDTFVPGYSNDASLEAITPKSKGDWHTEKIEIPAPRTLDWNKIGTTAAGVGVGSGLLSAAGKNWLREPKKKDGGLTQYQQGNSVLRGALIPDRPMSYSDMPVVAEYFPTIGNPQIAPVSASADNMPAPYQASGPIDIDAALKAVAGAESGSRPGQTKLGKRTDLVGEGGKRASASGTYQITTDTLKQIYSKYFKDDYPSFTNFNNSVKTNAEVEYSAARALMTENINKYGIYGIGAWYYPQYAAKAAAGDMSVWNKIPRQDYGNKLTWGQDFTKKYNLYKQYAKFKEGGEYELDDNEIQDILANGGQIEYL